MKHTCSIWSTNSAIIKNVRIDVLKYTYKKKKKNKNTFFKFEEYKK